jgi:hypothetical protein
MALFTDPSLLDIARGESQRQGLIVLYEELWDAINQRRWVLGGEPLEDTHYATYSPDNLVTEKREVFYQYLYQLGSSLKTLWGFCNWGKASEHVVWKTFPEFRDYMGLVESEPAISLWPWWANYPVPTHYMSGRVKTFQDALLLLTEPAGENRFSLDKNRVESDLEGTVRRGRVFFENPIPGGSLQPAWEEAISDLHWWDSSTIYCGVSAWGSDSYDGNPNIGSIGLVSIANGCVYNILTQLGGQTLESASVYVEYDTYNDITEPISINSRLCGSFEYSGSDPDSQTWRTVSTDTLLENTIYDFEQYLEGTGDTRIVEDAVLDTLTFFYPSNVPANDVPFNVSFGWKTLQVFSDISGSLTIGFET